MNQQQIKYALKRAEEIYRARLKKIAEKHTVAAVHLDKDGILAALRARKYQVKPKYEGWGGDIRSFIYLDEETEQKTDTDAIKSEQAALKAEYDGLTDELMLGDQQEALNLLRLFAQDD